jgi:hypothetical protein
METEVEGPLTLCVAACEVGALLTCDDALDLTACVDEVSETTVVPWAPAEVVPGPSGWVTVLRSGRSVTAWARVAGTTSRRRPNRLVERRISKNTVWLEVGIASVAQSVEPTLRTKGWRLQGARRLCGKMPSLVGGTCVRGASVVNRRD